MVVAKRLYSERVQNTSLRRPPFLSLFIVYSSRIASKRASLFSLVFVYFILECALYAGNTGAFVKPI
jgi:hypothetical protein